MSAFAALAIIAAVWSDPGVYRAEVLRDGPLVWLRFEDRSGPGVPGIGGQSLDLDGKHHVDIPASPQLLLEELTVELWFRSSQEWKDPYWPGSATLASKATEGNASGDWTIIGGSSAQGLNEGLIIVGVGPRGGNDVLLRSPAHQNDGSWHHVVWTRFASGENRLYIDGGLADSATDGGGPIANDRPIQIGGDPHAGGKGFIGLIDEVAIYGKPLAADRVEAHTRAGGLEPRKWPVREPAAAPEHGSDLPPVRSYVLGPETLGRYVERFNRLDREAAVNHIPNSAALDWLERNVPRFECPDRDIEEIYHFRWWTYRKHLKRTPDGFVVTEFLPQVGWAGKHNTISCAAGHHIYEGRWIHDPAYLDDYSRFWFRGGGEPRRYSFWAADAIHARSLVSGDRELEIDLLPDLVRNFEAWEKEHRDANGLFWQIDDRDGMEVSIGGSGYRATINSYMYGDAKAIAAIAELAGETSLAARFRAEAAKIKDLVEENLWDREAEFFMVLPRGAGAKLAGVRELHGYTPWYFDLPGPQFSAAWRQIADPQGFRGPFGPTTAERRHPRFRFANDHECLWNGPSWPYATSVTLTALANFLDHDGQGPVGREEYFDLLRAYARSQHLRRPDGKVAPWIDEDLDADTGEWIARSILEKRGIHDRGEDYNHSTFCDLVITGLGGLRPRPDDVLEVHPLLPGNAWDYFGLDGVSYHGRALTILHDRTGARYGRGAGLHVLVDGAEVASKPDLERIEVPLPRTAPPVRIGDETAAGWVKAVANPVLGGDLGTCFDISVLEEGGRYRMWFSWRPKKSVALVESPEGISWSKPEIVLGPDPDRWDADVNRPVVLRRPDGYHMWYTGQREGRSWIGYATSPDGKTWKRMSKEPVLGSGMQPSWEGVAVMCPHGLFDEGRNMYRMWYSGGEQYEPNAIGYAESPDGLAWNKREENPVFRPDPTSEWENERVTACQVVLHRGWHVMFYIGFSDVNTARIGLARSRDGITGWQRHPQNPIIRPGKDRWDHDAVYKPYAVFDGRRWLLWYNGRRGGVEQIGLAVHDGEDLGFPEGGK